MRRARPKGLLSRALDRSRFGPAEEIVTNVFFIRDAIDYCHRLRLHRLMLAGAFVPNAASRRDCPILFRNYAIQKHCSGADSVESYLTNERTCADQNSGLRRIILVLLALGVVSMAVADRRRCDEFDLVSRKIHPVAGPLCSGASVWQQDFLHCIA
jgi:hypothetical protein